MKIDVNMNEINSVEKIISKVLVENDFNGMNHLVNKNQTNINTKFLFPNVSNLKNSNFVSIQKNNSKPYLKVITESEFYKIVGVTKRGISKKSGRFQQKLYSHYLEAVRLNDDGYISDVLEKALEFQTNLNYIKSLMKNKAFMNEWRKDFGNESAIEVFKNKGSMRLVNIVLERTA